MPRISHAIPYILLATTGVAFWLAWHYWQRRRQAGAAWFACGLVSCGVWTCLDALSFLIDHPAGQELARRLVWPLVLGVTVSFFRFACAYAQRTRWWRAVRVPTAGAVVLEIALMVTNQYHHLVWRETQWVDLGFTRIPWLAPGAAFYWLHLPLNYALLLGGVLVLFANALGSQRFYVQRIAVLSIAMLTPLLVNVFVVAQLTQEIDLTPVALVVSFAGVARATFHYRLLDVMPTVRSLLFQQHGDGVVVLDPEYRVIDGNPAARHLLASESPPGTPAAVLLPFWKQVRDAVQAGDGRSVEVAHGAAVVEIRSLLIHDDKHRPIGRLFVLHDVTERARLIRELDAYARTVAHDLKNPLSAAAGYLDLVRMTEPQMNEESARLLSQAEDVCHQMAGIIDGLLRRRPAQPTK